MDREIELSLISHVIDNIDLLYDIKQRIKLLLFNDIQTLIAMLYLYIKEWESMLSDPHSFQCCEPCFSHYITMSISTMMRELPLLRRLKQLPYSFRFSMSIVCS
jgi:hypothetical protein